MLIDKAKRTNHFIKFLDVVVIARENGHYITPTGFEIKHRHLYTRLSRNMLFSRSNFNCSKQSQQNQLSRLNKKSQLVGL